MYNIGAGEEWLRPPSIPRKPALRRSAQSGAPPPSPGASRCPIAAPSLSPAELVDRRAAAAGVALSARLRQAVAHTRTWTAPATAVERERTRQIARIGSHVNQVARMCRTTASRGPSTGQSEAMARAGSTGLSVNRQERYLWLRFAETALTTPSSWWHPGCGRMEVDRTQRICVSQARSSLVR